MASSRQSCEPVNQTSRDIRCTVEQHLPVGGLAASQLLNVTLGWLIAQAALRIAAGLASSFTWAFSQSRTVSLRQVIE
jgi:hypothetical protein